VGHELYLYQRSNYHGAMLCHVDSRDPAYHARVCLQRFFRVRPGTITTLPAQLKTSIEKFEEPNVAAKPAGYAAKLAKPHPEQTQQPGAAGTKMATLDGTYTCTGRRRAMAPRPAPG